MRPVIVPLACAALAVAAFLSSPATEAKAAEITIRADPWCPFNCRPGDAEPGYGIEMAKLAFAKAGHTLNYELMPWARAIDAVRAGSIDAVIGAQQTGEEGRGLVFPKQSIGPARNIIALRRDSAWTYAGPASLEKLSLGAVLGYSYTPEVDAHIAKHKDNVQMVQFVGGDDAAVQNLKKLAAGRISGVVETENVITYAAKKIGVTDQLRIVGVGADELVYVAFAPKSPRSAAYAKAYDDGVAALRASGELAKILAKYGITDWN